jgi:two-component system sensor histidine kinase and response regulator WspE
VAVSVVSLARLLGLAEAPPAAELSLVLLAGADGRRWALAVDALLGQTELALQALDVRLGKQQDVAAAAVLDDGSPVLMLDVDDLANSLAAWAAAGAAQAAGSASAEASGGATPSALRRRVLVVEDSFAVREVERKLLAAAGYDVSVAVDGMDGWNALRAGHFDLVLTDIDMPRMTGIELLQQIRASERHRELPVMVVSYKEREADRLRGLQAGASHYFSKSQFDEAALLQAVADLIGAPAA